VVVRARVRVRVPVYACEVGPRLSEVLQHAPLVAARREQRLCLQQEAALLHLREEAPVASGGMGLAAKREAGGERRIGLRQDDGAACGVGVCQLGDRIALLVPQAQASGHAL